MPAIVLDITEPQIPLPEFIVLDANVILELYPTSNPGPYHQLAIDFLNYLHSQVHQGLVVPIIPRLVLEECYFKLCKQYLVQVATLRGENWVTLHKNNPTILRGVLPALMQFRQILNNYPFIISEPEDLITSISDPPPLADRMLDFIQRFNILPKDATILSEAERMGIDTVVSLDRDWKRNVSSIVRQIANQD